jgi:hypothetical protein
MPGSRLEKQGNGLLEAKRRRKSAAGAEVRSPATGQPQKTSQTFSKRLWTPRGAPSLVGRPVRRWRGQPALSDSGRRQPAPRLVCELEQADIASLLEGEGLRPG